MSQELQWGGIHAEFKADWKTPELLLEGSLGCGKSTVALDKEIDALQRFPGIPILLARWTEEAVSTKLKKAFEEILFIRGITAEWDAKSKFYRFANGSIAHMFGLKAISAIERYSKIRSLGVCRIMVDQAEEMEKSVADELRGRLRPDLSATMSGQRFPFQLTFVANPSADEFWLSKQFPTDNRIKGRRLFSLAVFDNPFLPQETIDGLIRTYGPDHPKHQTMVLGKRGLNVIGDPIFDGIFDRSVHVAPLAYDPQGIMLESYEVGKHNPAWVATQQTYDGGIRFLGGVIGQGLILEDFLPLVQHCRSEWWPEITFKQIRTCTAPMGDKVSDEGRRYSLLRLLRDAGIVSSWEDNANSPDVRLAMIEYLGSCLRRRLKAKEESLVINADPSRWLVASLEGHKESPFLEHAFAGGYTWSEHYVSVSNKEIRQPHEDDWFANAMHAAEHIALNFCAGRPSVADAMNRRYRQSQTESEYQTGISGPNAWLSW